MMNKFWSSHISRKIIYFGALVVALGILLSLRTISTHKTLPPENNNLHTQTEAGISINGIGGESAAKIDRMFADIASLGFSQIRIDMPWFSVQHSSSQQYLWKSYDVIVHSANRHHLKVVGILDYAPAWAAQTGCINFTGCAPKNPAQFAVFAAQAAKHYKQDVQEWEIWNEENIGKFWSPAANAAQYVPVLKQSYAAIKAVNPDDLVILGGLAAGDNPDAKQVDAVSFLEQVYKAGAKGSFDAVGYHPYTYPRTPFDANTAWAKLSRLHAVMQANGDGAKRVWITEYGAPTNGPSGSGFVSEAVQAQLVREAFTTAEGQAWIGPFFWYNYQDRSSDTSTKENFFGLRRADGSPKPAYYAWQQLLSQ